MGHHTLPSFHLTYRLLTVSSGIQSTQSIHLSWTAFSYVVSILDTIIGVKQDFKAGKPALTEALNTIKDETKQHKIPKLNALYGNICKWSLTIHNNQTDEKHKGCNFRRYYLLRIASLSTVDPVVCRSREVQAMHLTTVLDSADGIRPYSNKTQNLGWVDSDGRQFMNRDNSSYW